MVVKWRINFIETPEPHGPLYAGYRQISETWIMDEKGMALIGTLIRWVPFDQVVWC